MAYDHVRVSAYAAALKAWQPGSHSRPCVGWISQSRTAPLSTPSLPNRASDLTRSAAIWEANLFLLLGLLMIKLLPVSSKGAFVFKAIHRMVLASSVAWSWGPTGDTQGPTHGTHGGHSEGRLEQCGHLGDTVLALGVYSEGTVEQCGPLGKTLGLTQGTDWGHMGSTGKGRGVCVHKQQ